MTNDDVVRLCLRKIEMGIPPEQICEELMTECLSPDLLMAGTDNMTVVLICFLHNKSYEELSKRAKEINEHERRKADELHNAYTRVNSYLSDQTTQAAFADMQKAFNDTHPSTSADSSESVHVNSINVNVSKFHDGGDEAEDDHHDDKDDSDNEHQDDGAKKNGTVDDGTSIDSLAEQHDAINGPVSSPKSPRNPSDLSDDIEQESKKHKENETNDDLK